MCCLKIELTDYLLKKKPMKSSVIQTIFTKQQFCILQRTQLKVRLFTLDLFFFFFGLFIRLYPQTHYNSNYERDAITTQNNLLL